MKIIQTPTETEENIKLMNIIFMADEHAVVDDWNRLLSYSVEVLPTELYRNRLDDFHWDVDS